MQKADIFIVPRSEYDPSAPGVKVGANADTVIIALPTVDLEKTAEIEAEGDLMDDPAEPGKKTRKKRGE